jgi:hypothetical protein
MPQLVGLDRQLEELVLSMDRKLDELILSDSRGKL